LNGRCIHEREAEIAAGQQPLERIRLGKRAVDCATRGAMKVDTRLADGESGLLGEVDERIRQRFRRNMNFYDCALRENLRRQREEDDGEVEQSSADGRKVAHAFAIPQPGTCMS
jgi:hypothetical protein